MLAPIPAGKDQNKACNCVIVIICVSKGIKGTIVSLTGNAATDSITVSVTSIVGTNANSAAAHNTTLLADESQKLFKDQFHSLFCRSILIS